MKNQKNNSLQEKIDKLKQLIPEIFSDGKLDINELENLLNGYTVEKEEKYRFEWWGKRRSQRLAYLPVTETLIPKMEDSKNFNETNNLYIEGDNLEVLKILRDTYANKIKVIYIDPPYNTGNEFIYKDDFKEPLKNYQKQTGLIDDEGRKTTTDQDVSGRKHTNWLNMMYPRLLLARDFLSEDGVIFISIDDIELANMRKICDEIFGDSNLISNSVRVSNSAKNNADYVSDTHDYTLIYAKNISRLNEKWSVPKNNYKEFESRAKRLLRMGLSGEEIEKELRELVKYPRFYDFDHFYYVDEKGVYQTGDPGGVQNGNFKTEVYHPITKKKCKKPSGGWRNKHETMLKLIKEDRLHFGEDENTIPRIKRYLKDNLENVPRSIYFYDTQIDTKRWKEEGIYFDFPKPVEYIKQLLRMGSDKESIIMDFFSGSGTTAEAVMQLNAEDGGKRKFILVQLPEDLDQQLKNAKGSNAKNDLKKNIEFLKSINKPLKLTELAKERIRRSGDYIIKEKPELQGKLDIGFKVFEYAETNFPVWDEEIIQEEINVQLENIIDNDLDHKVAIYEVLLLLKTYELTAEIKTLDEKGLYQIGKDDPTLVFLGKELEEEIYLKILDIQDKYNQIIIYDNSFESDSQKQNMIAQIGHQKLDFI